jgi:3-mercaptopyruvate sulfurtransferase SseA
MSHESVQSYILGGPLTVAIFIAVRELWVLRVMGHDEIVPDDTPG